MIFNNSKALPLPLRSGFPEVLRPAQGRSTDCRWNAPFLRGLAGALLLWAALASCTTRAEAQAFHSVRGLLGNHFQGATSVSFVRVRPNATQKAAVEKVLGQALPKSEYVFYVAKKGEQVVGYALFDQERGQHELIDFATFFDARGKVTRVEVVAYREPYGDGIRSERFRRQFVGRDAHSALRPGHEIDVVSGATLSTQAMAKAVKRAAVLLERTVLAPTIAAR